MWCIWVTCILYIFATYMRYKRQWNYDFIWKICIELSKKCALCTYFMCPLHLFRGNWTQKWLIPDHCTICTIGWTGVRCAIWRKLGVFLGDFCAKWLIKNLGIFYWICEFIKKFRNNSVNCIYNLIVNILWIFCKIFVLPLDKKNFFP